MAKRGRPKKKATEEELIETEVDQEEEEGFIAHPEASPDEEMVEEEVEDTEEPEEEKVEEKEEELEETPTFKFEEEKSEIKEGVEEEGKPETVEIIHGGQAYQITKDKIIELAQKGFDYDKKVGPHGKLVQMIQSDPNLAQMINNYWQGKVSGAPDAGKIEDKTEFKAKPLEEYETETEWLQDNFQNFLKGYKFPIQDKIAEPPRDKSEEVKNMLKLRDPANFEKVFPVMMAAIPNLSVKDYQRIDSDLASLCQFYDFTKEQAAPAKEGNTQQNIPNRKPGFRVRSGGGDSPKHEEKADYAWNLPKEEFQKQIDRVKGYES